MPSTDQAGGMLARFPEPVTLYPSRRKWLLVFMGSLIFVLIGIWMIRSGQIIGSLPAAFFALVAIVAAAALLPGAGRLKLDNDGFEETSLFRNRRARWANTDRFTAVGIPPSMQRLVCYDDTSAAGGKIAHLNTEITGRNAALRDTYGFSAETLADLMSAWRERVLAKR